MLNTAWFMQVRCTGQLTANRDREIFKDSAPYVAQLLYWLQPLSQQVGITDATAFALQKQTDMRYLPVQHALIPVHGQVLAKSASRV